MDAVAQMLVLDLRDHLRCHLDAELHGNTLDTLFLALGCRCGKLVDHILRHRDAGDVFVHVPRHARSLERDDTSHDMRLDTGRVDLIQEALERFQIKNTLRLDVLRAVFDLLAQLVDLQLDGVIDRSDGSALVELRRAAGDLIAAAVAVRLLHLREHLQNADGIQIIDRLGFRTVADDGMVARQSQHRVDAEGRCGQNIAHDGHTVAVAAGHLQDRLDARILERDAQAEAGRLETGGLHIGHVDAVNLAVQELCSLQLLGKIITLRGGHFGGDAKFTGFKSLFQHTHIISSPLS